MAIWIGSFQTSCLHFQHQIKIKNYPEELSNQFKTLTVNDYVPIFKQFKISVVIRLNKPQYDAKVFEDAGIRLVELYFADGSTPSKEIIEQFLDIVEKNKDGVAVHCKAGLGRTGTLIGLYMMKHFRFCAADLIGWIRIIRPGSILGPQQQFLVQMQKSIFKECEISPIFNNMPIDYKEYTIKMEQTEQLMNLKLTEEELKIAMYGQDGQGGDLMDAKFNNKY